jgi:hypothetical protein
MRIARPAFFTGATMKLGLSITDDDQVVRLDPGHH